MKQISYLLSEINKDYNRFIIPLFIILAFVFTLPIIFSGNNLGIEDWDHHMAFLETARQSIVRYGQFPYWDPYHCGGMPLFGSPQSGLISIVFIFVLLLGTTYGVKVGIFFHFFIALSGMYLLIRHNKYSRLGSIVGSIVFSFSGAIASITAVGMLPFLYATYLPFIFLYLQKTLESKKGLFLNSLLGGSFLALAYYGGYQVPLLILPFIVLFILTSSIKDKNITILLRGLLFLFAFVLIASPKLALNIHLSSEYPRLTQGEEGGYTLPNLLHFLISPVQSMPNNYLFPIKELMDENTIYIGIASFIALIFGIRKLDFRYKIVLIVAFLLSLGTNTILSVYNLMKELPFYDQFRYAQRFRFILLVPVSLAIAAGMERIKEKYRFEAILLSIFITIDLLIFSGLNLFGNTFIVRELSWPSEKTGPPEPQIKMDVNYRLIKKLNMSEDQEFYYYPWGTEYPAVKNNIATIACYETVGYYSHNNIKDKIPVVSDKDVSISYWSPNLITLKLEEGTTPIDLNMNYHSGWHASSEGRERKVIKNNGLIRVERENTDNQIILKYDPYKDLFGRF